MAHAEWVRIFQITAKDLKPGDTWRLHFDDNLVPDSPEPGWKQYIRNTCARFKCSQCKRTWPSNRVMVVFHMRLTSGQGTVRARRLRQNCKTCTGAPMEEPTVDSDNIHILLENLVEKIRIKCYQEDLGQKNRPFNSVDVKSPHEPSHCEACLKGICTRNTAEVGFKPTYEEMLQLY